MTGGGYGGVGYLVMGLLAVGDNRMTHSMEPSLQACSILAVSTGSAGDRTKLNCHA